MNVKRTIGTAALALTALLVASAPAGATPGAGYMDAPERAAATTTGSDAVAYFRANELSTLVRSAGPAAIAYFNANERATMGPSSYVDVGMRGNRVASSTPLTVGEPTSTGGFDWGDAAVGASSAAMLLLLVGGSFVLVRHSRGRELAR